MDPNTSETSDTSETLDPSDPSDSSDPSVPNLRAFGHNYIGTEHLLLGLLADPENLGTRVLQTFGVTADHARKAPPNDLKKAFPCPTIRNHMPGDVYAH